ncbi:MAG: hypothetical protein ACYS7Y_35340 [Planctomycetota bacterium]|jgi:hypothetical protein
MVRKDARIYMGEMIAATRSTTGYPRGQETDPDNASQDTVHSSLVIEGVTFTPGVRVNPVVTIAGAQRILGRVVLPAADFGSPAYDVPYLNDLFSTIFIRKGTIDSSTLGRHTTGDNAQQNVFVPSFVRFMIRVQDVETGKEYWENLSYLNCRNRETTPGGAGRVTGDAENPNPFAYAGELTPSTRDMSGSLISALNLASTGGKDTMIRTISDNRTHVVNWISDGIATTFTLPYLPLSSTAISGTGANIVTVDGVVTAVSSISTTTGLVTLTAAPAAAAEVVVDYETDFITP